MPINEHSISPAMIEADDGSRVDVVNGQLLYRLIEGTAFLNGAKATVRHGKRAAAALDLGFHAERVLGEPQHAVAHFLTLQSIELFYKALSKASVGEDGTRHRLTLAHKSLPCEIKGDLDRRFGEIASRIPFTINVVADWVGEEPPERREIPEPDDELIQHLGFLDAMRWHLYKYSDERLSGDSARAWGYLYVRIEGWIEYAHLLRDQALKEARGEGAFAVTRIATTSGFALPMDFLEVLDDV